MWYLPLLKKFKFIILNPAVGDGNLTQSLEPESFAMGWSFTLWECPTPLQSDSNSRSCINLPSRTAGSRIILDSIIPGNWLISYNAIRIITRWITYMSIPAQKFREIVFQLLYGFDISKAKDEEMLKLITEELKVTKSIVRQAQEKAHQIHSSLNEIDEKIGSTSQSYNFERIQSVERNILRLAVFELTFSKEQIPHKVVIAEALRLARKFATKESATFINAILDAIYKSSLGKAIDAAEIDEAVKQLDNSEKIAQEAAIAQIPQQQFPLDFQTAQNEIPKED